MYIYIYHYIYIYSNNLIQALLGKYLFLSENKGDRAMNWLSNLRRYWAIWRCFKSAQFGPISWLSGLSDAKRFYSNHTSSKLGNVHLLYLQDCLAVKIVVLLSICFLFSRFVSTREKLRKAMDPWSWRKLPPTIGGHRCHRYQRCLPTPKETRGWQFQTVLRVALKGYPPTGLGCSKKEALEFWWPRFRYRDSPCPMVC